MEEFDGYQIFINGSLVSKNIQGILTRLDMMMEGWRPRTLRYIYLHRDAVIGIVKRTNEMPKEAEVFEYQGGKIMGRYCADQVISGALAREFLVEQKYGGLGNYTRKFSDEDIVGAVVIFSSLPFKLYKRKVEQDERKRKGS